MGKKLALAVTVAAHLPQLYNVVVKGESRKQARVFSDPKHFWTKKTLALHAAAIGSLFV